ncbi:hypothetical protein PTTG_07378 [Puccinia triticina 1-1 BBBD Race 1]|uniref:Uncharacterized protein n=1 Tax=Puccinia triticina (isolate 1-1 / race 1 (BBBD)) TaxID=630390 RepID=A0A0C4F2Q7_PUCT1|nr:hypothetical protein PTTG_07378 [Puccinia triticina 1-1 BBBD Race 1]WAR60272.1 hypothetical protein PtB15_9B209 [Puccinia triticina]
MNTRVLHSYGPSPASPVCIWYWLNGKRFAGGENTAERGVNAPASAECRKQRASRADGRRAQSSASQAALDSVYNRATTSNASSSHPPSLSLPLHNNRPPPNKSACEVCIQTIWQPGSREMSAPQPRSSCGSASSPSRRPGCSRGPTSAPMAPSAMSCVSSARRSEPSSPLDQLPRPDDGSAGHSYLDSLPHDHPVLVILNQEHPQWMDFFLDELVDAVDALLERWAQKFLALPLSFSINLPDKSSPPTHLTSHDLPDESL